MCSWTRCLLYERRRKKPTWPCGHALMKSDTVLILTSALVFLLNFTLASLILTKNQGESISDKCLALLHTLSGGQWFSFPPFTLAVTHRSCFSNDCTLELFLNLYKAKQGKKISPVKDAAAVAQIAVMEDLTMTFCMHVHISTKRPSCTARTVPLYHNVVHLYNHTEASH